MKTYITPETIEERITNLFAVCSGSNPTPDPTLTGDAPGIQGGGTTMAPGRQKVF